MEMQILLQSLILFLIVIAPTYAQESHVWAKSTSFVTLVPSNGPAVAIVIFKNEQIQVQTETFKLHIPGLTITVRTMVREGMMFDSIAVYVPNGFVAVPKVLDVEEGALGVTSIYSVLSAGS